MDMAQQNGGGYSGPPEQSRSGLLVAQQILNDKLGSGGEVRALLSQSLWTGTVFEREQYVISNASC